tara:strand:+ start:367 stop:582 length:216 start_codon:yes stop_codon:yes gene_type:complete
MEKAEEWYPQEFQDGDWHCQAVMGIEEVRILHDAVTEYLKIEEDLPPINKSYLEHIQSKMFAMICSYNLEL